MFVLYKLQTGLRSIQHVHFSVKFYIYGSLFETSCVVYTQKYLLILIIFVVIQLFLNFLFFI